MRTLNAPPPPSLCPATSGLDIEYERFIQDAVARVMRNKTVLVISNRLSTVRLADRVATLGDAGHILKTGSFEAFRKDAAFVRGAESNAGADEAS